MHRRFHRGGWSVEGYGRAITLAAAVAALRPLSFIHTAEWLDVADLRSENTLPLITDLGLNFGLGKEGLNATSGSCSFLVDGNVAPTITMVSAHEVYHPRGSAENLCIRAFYGFAGGFIADFGVLDIPVLGDVRTRAGLRYSPLYPRGALELGFRKVTRTDKDQGYQLFIGLQSTGDDERLDVLTEIGAIKLFHSARAFYRFLWGFGGPYQETPGSRSWNQMGSSLGVTQTDLPPQQNGQLTIGWRTGLLDVGLEGGKVLPPMLARRKAQKAKRGLRDNLLDSSPFAAYSVQLPRNAEVSWTILPEHEVLEHALHWSSGLDPTGGKVLVSAILEQSLSSPAKRLRIGTCYERK